jgi:DNA recombination protein RmuC
MDILPIVITAVSVSILWLAYLKFFKNDGSSQNQSELKDKEHEIELIKLGHEKELSVLKEKLNSIEIEKNHLEETLTKERETTKNQLETLGKVDAFKTSVTGNMGRYSEMIEKQQKFIDKLTGNAKYQGNFGEKFLEQSLQFHGFKLNVDYTKQKHEDIYNLEDDKSEITKPDIVLNIGNSTHIICDSKVSLDNWKKFVNSEDDQEKNDQFKKHYFAVKKHIDDLAKKDYVKNLKKQVFQKVIMYMCHEAAYLAALEHDPELYEYAFKKNVILCGPKNLFAVISIAQTIRDKEKQINSVKEITNTANNLMEKYAVLKGYLIKTMSSFNAHGDNLKKVIQGAYGRNGLEQRIEKLKDLGVNSTRPIAKTSAVEDEIIQLDTIENKNKESVKKIYS